MVTAWFEKRNSFLQWLYNYRNSLVCLKKCPCSTVIFILIIKNTVQSIINAAFAKIG